MGRYYYGNEFFQNSWAPKDLKTLLIQSAAYIIVFVVLIVAYKINERYK